MGQGLAGTDDMTGPAATLGQETGVSLISTAGTATGYPVAGEGGITCYLVADAAGIWRAPRCNHVIASSHNLAIPDGTDTDFVTEIWNTGTLKYDIMI